MKLDLGGKGVKFETKQENQFYVTDAKVLGTILYSSKITLDLRCVKSLEKECKGSWQRLFEIHENLWNDLQ